MSYSQTNREGYLRRIATIEGRAQQLFNNARQRAKKAQLEFSITKNWVIEQLRKGRCAQTALPFVIQACGTGPGTSNPWSPSLDRTNPSQGYTPSNTQVVCWIYNCAKSNFSPNDILLMAKALTV